MICRIDFDMFFGILKLTESEDFAWPLHDGRFSKWSHFSNIWWFLERFFAQNNFK